MDREIEQPMFPNLLKHVVEESDAGCDVALPGAVKIELDVDIGLLCGAPDLGCPFAGIEDFGYLVPCSGAVQDECLAAQVLCKLAVCVAVADDVAAGQVVELLVLYVFGEHACAWFAVGVVVLGEVVVNLDVVEGDAFAFECLKDEIVYRPEGVFRE